MKRLSILVSSALLVVATGPASAADDTFADCPSAINYGWNTSYFYVSSTLNSADCDGTAFERAEHVLSKTLKRQRIANRNSETIKACFYEGLYQGYVDALRDEHADCGTTAGLVPSIARAAVSVFSAMDTGLDWIDDSEVDQVFDGVFVHDESAGNACEAYIEGALPGGINSGVAELLASVCWND